MGARARRAMVAVLLACATGTAAEPALPTSAAAERLSAVTEVARASMSRGFEAMLTTALDLSTVPTATLPVPVAGDPILSLRVAVEQSIALLRDMPHVAVDDALAHIDAETAPLTEGIDARSLVVRPPADDAIARAAVVRARTQAAAGMLVRALDRWMPALRELPSPGARATGSGCDIHDALPILCVGSSANNVYTADAALLIDLGGDDLYRNTAGGAPFPYAGQVIPVSLNIDLAGDDTYDADLPASATTDALGLQGGASNGGVGLLVDLEGNDEYQVTSPAPSENGLNLAAHGAAFIGAGALFDLGGDDRYAARAAGGPGRVYLGAQGSGGAGVGVLADAGFGSDAYELWAPAVGTRDLAGQGSGNVGVGVLLEDGGSDTFMTTVGRPGDSAEQAYPSATIVAQSASVMGAALLVEGAGDTTYVAEGMLMGVGQSIVMAQGSSMVGDAALDDAGGNDSYRIASSARRTSRAVVDPTTCGRYQYVADVWIGGCDDVEVGVTGIEMMALAWGQGSATGMGIASPFASQALLRDREGDDTYEALSNYRYHVELYDRLPDPARVSLLHVRSPNAMPDVSVQGVGGSSSEAALLDGGGSDRYSMHYRKETTTDLAEVKADPVVDAISGGRLAIAAQGGASAVGGSGFLLDLGGASDTFTAHAETPISVDGDPTRALAYESYAPSFQGSAYDGADGTFVAFGDRVEVTSVPSMITCGTSARGFGTWSECGHLPASEPERTGFDRYATATGIAPGSVGSPSLVTIEEMPESVSRGPGRMPVVARVVDSTGAPVAGATVHIDLHTSSPVLGEPQPTLWWYGLWTTDAVTDADGIARGVVPTDFTDVILERFPVTHWRVFVTFDGGNGLYPDHAARALTVL